MATNFILDKRTQLPFIRQLDFILNAMSCLSMVSKGGRLDEILEMKINERVPCYLYNLL